MREQTNISEQKFYVYLVKNDIFLTLLPDYLLGTNDSFALGIKIDIIFVLFQTAEYMIRLLFVTLMQLKNREISIMS
mgnify:CR=1 FL=1